MADLVITNARLVATMDEHRRELPGGWVSVVDGRIDDLGIQDPPLANEVIDAAGCLVTPGLVNTHHHLYQNLTRAYQGMTDKRLFGWLQSLYPLWKSLDEESIYV